MRAKLPSNAFSKFILISGSAYLGLYLVYQYVVKQYTYYDQKFIGQIIEGADFILKTFGYKTFKVLQDRDMQVVGIDGSNGVWVGSNCNAITLFGLFAVFIIAYPGQHKNKWWFVISGIIAIHLLNIFRVVGLALLSLKAPAYLDFNHTYTFTFIIYGFIFVLWMIWINRFATKDLSSEKV
jgi:exosortase family protein XrtF